MPTTLRSGDVELTLADDSAALRDGFAQTVLEMIATHDKKSKDYGTDGDPFANIRASERFGIPAWLGAIIRLNDKITRISSFCIKGRLENESLEDAIIDNAVYGAIAVTLYRQLHAKTDKTS